MVLFTNAPEWMQGIAQAVNNLSAVGIAAVDNFHNQAIDAAAQLFAQLP